MRKFNIEITLFDEQVEFIENHINDILVLSDLDETESHILASLVDSELYVYDNNYHIATPTILLNKIATKYELFEEDLI